MTATTRTLVGDMDGIQRDVAWPGTLSEHSGTPPSAPQREDARWQRVGYGSSLGRGNRALRCARGLFGFSQFHHVGGRDDDDDDDDNGTYRCVHLCG